MKKIYLSGPVSGRSREEAKEQFAKAEKFLLKHYGNIQVFNPMKFTEYAPEKKWQDYMHTCLEVLETCDVILMLGGWRESLGCKCEFFYAKGCGIEPWVMCTDVLTSEPRILADKRICQIQGDNLIKHSNGYQFIRIYADEHFGQAVVDDSELPNSL